MTRILLSPPEPMSSRLERLRLIPGRHLGRTSLERLQAYTDARLEHLLAGARPGILRGSKWMCRRPAPVPRWARAARCGRVWRSTGPGRPWGCSTNPGPPGTA